MTQGPARVCIRQTSVEVDRGETAYLAYLGIHHGSIRVDGPRGSFELTDGEAWAVRRNRAELVPDRQGRAVERHYSRRKLAYWIYAPGALPGVNAPRIMLEGKAIGRSAARDAAILNRIVINRDEPTGCRRHFDYGWEIVIRTSK